MEHEPIFDLGTKKRRNNKRIEKKGKGKGKERISNKRNERK